jgi:hypothetical protein
MRGHKHPLEIFRQNGQSFPTRDGAVPPPPVPRAEVVGAPLIQIQPRRLVKPRSGKRTPTLATSADIDPRPVKRPPARRRRVAALASAGLVLLVGVTYAVGLWPFARGGSPGSGGFRLSRGEGERSFLTDWMQKDRGDQPGGGEANGSDGVRHGPSGDGSAAPTKSGEKPADGAAKPTAPTTKEYWVVVASATLTEADRKKKPAELKALFANEEKRLKKGLGARLDAFEMQPIFTSQKKEEMVLRIGRGATQDDPRLIDLRDRVKSLGGSFKDATIRGYVPATK